jgi:formylmethanofuran dehydrogenase subunit B
MAGALRVRGFFCGLPCAEMTLVPGAAGEPLRVEGGCPICREEIARLGDDGGPAARVGGREAGVDEAIEAACDILMEARAPFLYGLAHSGNRTARLAASLAAALRASLDVEGAGRHAPDLLSLQTFGLPGATFGEIAARADLLILWRCDPRPGHPRLFERPPATPLRAGGARAVIRVPPEGAAGKEDATAREGAADREGAAAREVGDLLLPVAAGSDLEAALALRALVAGRSLPADPIGGVATAALRRAAGMIAAARYVGLLWDLPDGGPARAALAATLTLLARDLNRERRCAARPLGAVANLAGAMGAVASATGAPRAVGFAAGRPRYAPGEHDASRMIGRGAADALLLIGARALPAGPRGEAGRAAGPRTIVVGPRLPGGAGDPDVAVLTAAPGLSDAGSARRADGVPVVLRAVLESTRPTEEQVLERIVARIAARRARAPRERPR